MDRRKPTIKGKQRKQYVIKGTPGVRSDLAKLADTPRKVFDLFFDNNMIKIIIIVKMTNKKIARTLKRLPNEITSSDKYTYLKETDKTELYACIGLMYARGLLGQNNLCINHIFSDKTGHPIFGATMSRDKFAFLLSRVSFDKEDTRSEQWQKDRFAAFREIFELFSLNGSSTLFQVSIWLLMKPCIQ